MLEIAHEKTELKSTIYCDESSLSIVQYLERQHVLHRDPCS